MRADQGGIEPPQKAFFKAVDALESYALSKWQLVLLPLFCTGKLIQCAHVSLTDLCWGSYMDDGFPKASCATHE